ncbi:MAG: class I tRNA ligase family protein [Nakamurella sp.]
MTGSPDNPTAGPGEAPDAAPPFRYTPALAGEIELRWQDFWQDNGTFHTPNPTGPLSVGNSAGAGRHAALPAKKAYILDMFPYPSGAGLHVGHPLGYIGTDVLGRYLRMTGRNVLHTIGYDAFGLPAEQYAVRTGTHPRTTTEANVAHYRKQLRRMGFGHDERRSVATTDTEFFRWTQWIFLQVFNSWFDPEANDGVGRARPITELEAEFTAGTRPTPGETPWVDMTVTQQQKVLAGYRLAYIDEAPVNWCPGLGTALSNEEVTSDGTSEIGNFPVFRRSLRQWMMRITSYADRLIDDLDRLDWPESVKSMQRHWIGRSTGAEVTFLVERSAVEGSAVEGSAGDTSAVEGSATDSRATEHDGAAASVETPTIAVYTTRPDTLFGATYMVLAPENPVVDAIVAGTWPDETKDAWTDGAATPAVAVAAYRLAASRKSDLDRQDTHNKTGVFTGRFAINPVDGRRLPIFIADYVLMGYGTGAIMAVPAQDSRDWDFAKAFDLPIIRTVQPPAGHDEDAPFTGDGPAINSACGELSLNGLSVVDAKAAMIEYLQARGVGAPKVQYKLRDWLFSRQRYWGEPFPIVYDEDDMPIALPDEYLPLELPEVEDYTPQAFDPHDATSTPVPPLNRATEWKTVTLDLGDGPKEYRRELNVMPQWAGSCWYELRYLDPTNSETFCDPEVEKYWMGPRDDAASDGVKDPGGVDLYVGGVEHAVLHLLYSRFWHKVLYDLGYVSSEEPFRRLFNQGYIQAYAYTDERGFYVPAEEVTEDKPGEFYYQGTRVNREYGKMGKSLNNVVTPDVMCETYGADTFRLYEMSMGPLDVSRPWQTKDAVGAQRYLQRLWRLVVDETTGDTIVTEASADEATRKLLHRTIDGVRTDLEGMLYNTAIAKLIMLCNHITKSIAQDGGQVSREVAEALTLMTAPLAPHIAEELWRKLGHDESLAHGPFPDADPQLIKADEVEYPIQVQGKVRAHITVPAGSDKALVEAAALADPRIVEILGGNAPRKIVVVAGRMVSIVP